MKKSTFGALLLIFLGAGAIGAWILLKPLLFEREQRHTSDAGATLGDIRIGGDNYLGYWFLVSPEMKKTAARKGLKLEFEDDGGDYVARLEKFAAGGYECIVLPVNSYLQHGVRHRFPGVIVAAIAESKGADGIVGFSDRLPSGKINDLNDPNLTFVYTAQSPSSFLLDLTIADFDLDRLTQNQQWRSETSGSRDVYDAARKGQGDVFVLWEPDLSKALELPGMKYVWGSDKFSGYIIDVFVFNREFLKKEPELVTEFFSIYFRVLSIYANNRDLMIKDMSQTADLKKTVVENMLNKIEWFDLGENCRNQFGIPSRVGESVSDGIVNCIIACTNVLLRTGRLDRDPLEGNPYLITNSSVLEDLQKTQGMSLGQSGVQRNPTFDPLDAKGWAQLQEVGTFRVQPITFQSWNNRLTQEGKDTVDQIAALLKNNYPHYRVIIRGHTAPGGDERENEKLSLERAQAVLQYLKAVHGVEAARLLAEGCGSKMPPEKKPGESPRAYQYRLARVAFIALEGNPL